MTQFVFSEPSATFNFGFIICKNEILDCRLSELRNLANNEISENLPSRLNFTINNILVSKKKEDKYITKHVVKTMEYQAIDGCKVFQVKVKGKETANELAMKEKPECKKMKTIIKDEPANEQHSIPLEKFANTLNDIGHHGVDDSESFDYNSNDTTDIILPHLKRVQKM